MSNPLRHFVKGTLETQDGDILLTRHSTEPDYQFYHRVCSFIDTHDHALDLGDTFPTPPPPVIYGWRRLALHQHTDLQTMFLYIPPHTSNRWVCLSRIDEWSYYFSVFVKQAIVDYEWASTQEELLKRSSVYMKNHAVRMYL